MCGCITYGILVPVMFVLGVSVAGHRNPDFSYETRGGLIGIVVALILARLIRVMRQLFRERVLHQCLQCKGSGQVRGPQPRVVQGVVIDPHLMNAPKRTPCRSCSGTGVSPRELRKQALASLERNGEV